MKKAKKTDDREVFKHAKLKAGIDSVLAALDPANQPSSQTEEYAKAKAFVEDSFRWAISPRINKNKIEMIQALEGLQNSQDVEQHKELLKSSIKILRANESLLLAHRVFLIQNKQRLIKLGIKVEKDAKNTYPILDPSQYDAKHKTAIIIYNYSAEVDKLINAVYEKPLLGIAKDAITILLSFSKILDDLDAAGTWTPEVNDDDSLQIAQEYLRFFQHARLHLVDIDLEEVAPGLVLKRIGKELSLEKFNAAYGENRPYNKSKLLENSMFANMTERIKAYTKEPAADPPEGKSVIDDALSLIRLCDQEGNVEDAEWILDGMNRVATLYYFDQVFSHSVEEQFENMMSDIEKLQKLQLKLNDPKKGYDPEHPLYPRCKKVLKEIEKPLLELLPDQHIESNIKQLKKSNIKSNVVNRTVIFKNLNSKIEAAINAKKEAANKFIVSLEVPPKLSLWQRFVNWVKRVWKAIVNVFKPTSTTVKAPSKKEGLATGTLVGTMKDNPRPTNVVAKQAKTGRKSVSQGVTVGGKQVVSAQFAKKSKATSPVSDSGKKPGTNT